MTLITGAQFARFLQTVSGAFFVDVKWRILIALTKIFPMFLSLITVMTYVFHFLLPSNPFKSILVENFITMRIFIKIF